MTTLVSAPVQAEGQAVQAVVYLRVSTREQAERDGDPEGYSLPAQRQACYRKAEALNATVIEEFVDRGESAKTANRPELQRLLTYLQENPTQYVIVHKVDRLARSRADDVTINLVIQKSGARLVSVTENIDETPSGMLLHGIMSTIAEFYSRNLAAEVLKGTTQKAKSGGTPGRAPVGYRNVILLQQGVELRTVELDPERAPLMRWAFEAYATGEWSTEKLLAELTGRGLTTLPTKTRPGKALVKSHFIRMLKHPYYKGLVRYRGVEYPGRHEPLVDDLTWQTVQDVLAAQSLAGEKRRIHQHHLKGSVFCKHCHSRLVISHTTNRHGVVYPYFVCSGRKRQSPCPQRAMLIDQVEELIERYYSTVQLAPEVQDKIRNQIKVDLAARSATLVREQAAHASRRQTLLDERQKLLQAHYAGALPLDLLKTEQTRISQELAAAENLLGDVEARLEAALLNLDEVIALLGDCHAAYLNAPATVRRQFNQAIFTALYVGDDETVSGEFAEPFALLLSPQLEPESRSVLPTLDPVPAVNIFSTYLENKQPATLLGVTGWNVNYLVELRGLEPLTPTLPGQVVIFQNPRV